MQESCNFSFFIWFSYW